MAVVGGTEGKATSSGVSTSVATTCWMMGVFVKGSGAGVVVVVQAAAIKGRKIVERMARLWRMDRIIEIPDLTSRLQQS